MSFEKFSLYLYFYNRTDPSLQNVDWVWFFSLYRGGEISRLTIISLISWNIASWKMFEEQLDRRRRRFEPTKCRKRIMWLITSWRNHCKKMIYCGGLWVIFCQLLLKRLDGSWWYFSNLPPKSFFKFWHPETTVAYMFVKIDLSK